MAKLLDKLYNRTIEGKLTLQEGDELEGVTPKYEVNSVESLTSEQIESLKAGDIVVKKTGNQRHAYIVSYKENGQGICLTYVDASCVETVSYDKSGSSWVFNSKDVTPLDFTNVDIKAKTLEQSEANWVATFEETTSIPEGITFTKYFEKVEVINGVMYMVFNYSLQNTTESAISLGNSWIRKVWSVPQAIAQKIYRRDGQNIDRTQSATPADNFICPLYTKYGQYDFMPTDIGAYIGQEATRSMSLRIAGLSVPANTTIVVSGRIFLTLI